MESSSSTTTSSIRTILGKRMNGSPNSVNCKKNTTDTCDQTIIYTTKYSNNVEVETLCSYSKDEQLGSLKYLPLSTDVYNDDDGVIVLRMVRKYIEPINFFNNFEEFKMKADKLYIKDNEE